MHRWWDTKARGGHEDVFQYLLIRNRDPQRLNGRGNTILSYAATRPSLEPVETILKLCLRFEKGSLWSSLHWACRKGDVALIKLLTTHGAENYGITTSVIPGEWTPHEMAVFHQNAKLVSPDGKTTTMGVYREMQLACHGERTHTQCEVDRGSSLQR